MKYVPERVQQLVQGLSPAARGAGPLLQRDYWAVIRNCRLRPSEVAALVADRFWEFPPEDLVRFRRSDGTDKPLEVGDEMEVRIRMAGTFRVRVVHRDTHSLTIATLVRHPEAGRITFGAYPNDYGDVIFHIRSRARSGSEAQYLGFVTAGEPMQTNTWTDFINNVAATVGEGVMGYVHAETRRLREDPDRPEDTLSPTFVARGG